MGSVRTEHEEDWRKVEEDLFKVIQMASFKEVYMQKASRGCCIHERCVKDVWSIGGRRTVKR